MKYGKKSKQVYASNLWQRYDMWIYWKLLQPILISAHARPSLICGSVGWKESKQMITFYDCTSIYLDDDDGQTIYVCTCVQRVKSWDESALRNRNHIFFSFVLPSGHWQWELMRTREHRKDTSMECHKNTVKLGIKWPDNIRTTNVKCLAIVLCGRLACNCSKFENFTMS